MTKVSDYFHKRRLSLGLSRAALARQVGYKNISKGIRRIEHFEQKGEITNELFGKLSKALDVDPWIIQQLSMIDLAEWLQCKPNPKTPYYTLGRAGPFTLPDFMADEGTLLVAMGAAHTNNKPVCLVMSSRIIFHISVDGDIEKIVEAGVPLPQLP